MSRSIGRSDLPSRREITIWKPAAVKITRKAARVPVRSLIAWLDRGRVRFACARETEALNDSGHLSRKRSPIGPPFRFHRSGIAVLSDRSIVLSNQSSPLGHSYTWLVAKQREQRVVTANTTSVSILRALFLSFCSQSCTFRTILFYRSSSSALIRFDS